MEFVIPDLIWGSKKIPYTTLTWSGTDTQASRQIEFDVPWNPYDKSLPRINMAKGEVVELRAGDKKLFIGVITEREKSDQIGTASYVAKDYMHYLLRSTGTYIFKNTTPEAIAKKVCTDLGIKTSGLFKTGLSIKKMIFENQCLYDIIIKAYRKVKSETGKNYLPVMDGAKVSVIEKGDSSGVTLTQGVNITLASYSDNIDNVVDLVKIYNSKHKKVGEVKNDKHIQSFGVYQAAYQKESGKNATKAAKAMLQGTTREASVDALGDIRALSGYSITIKDSTTGLDGKFFITADTHKFEGNKHTMSLDLAWKDSMESGAQTYKKQKTASVSVGGGGGGISLGGIGNLKTVKMPKFTVNNDKKYKTPYEWAYYLDVQTGYGYMGEKCYAQTYYHSTSGCKVLKKEKKKYKTGLFYSKKVGELEKVNRLIKIPRTHGKAFRTCPCCWR